MTSRVVLSAGSNIGDTRAHLQTVVDALGDDLRAVSDVYTTPPWGGVEQDDFANITLIADGDRTPREWLEWCWECERAADRVREVRWGPRTLDVDVVSAEIDGTPVLSDDETLLLPHPRARLRAFVLVPWLQVDPDARLWTPDGVRPVADLIADLAPADVAGVRRAGALT
ncbi:2-amino-4-hydroxy-6-hydroxymethyldihydropteridine diphosphokinase [Gordonia hydrophobica]|uniref:2-amino-4-hydroxy-6-hydroxymethyldihydropteridine diphosphokinase n=1 Tax=Gordonia hydrophobica TaxID=40516 RepID=A0ABZ2UAE1_9ACTN|nr:2-amino-4-hydroxy-6-hydroxymethyldihydropteridine diphosphokinase [Gordonia hydrophobica]MBM7366102.1 2-amino-4-hydroxy-6-hydroxymethyldihydropteridine diphosphokinase [Gordonia hydrophobica]